MANGEMDMRVFEKPHFIVLFVGLVAFAAVLWQASIASTAPYALNAAAKSQVAFHSKATLESFDGKAKKISVSLDVDSMNLAKTHGAVTVDLRSLDTGIDLRNKHMRENHLHTDSFPNAVFTIDSVGGAKMLGRSEKAKITVWGAMTIHGTTKPLSVPATLASISGSGYRLQSEFPLRITEYGIPRPEFLFLKLAEDVRITVDLTMIPSVP